MDDAILTEVLTEVRGLRGEVASWRQEMGERLAVTETKITDLYGNGRDGRMTVVEGKLNQHSKVIWVGTGAILAIQTIFAFILRWAKLR